VTGETIHGAALHRRAGPPDPSSGQVHAISAADAGWRYVGFSDHRLRPGSAVGRPADDHEVALIVVEGAVSVRVGRRRHSSLGSRDGVFAGPPPPVLLVAPGSALEVVAETQATVILADAPGVGAGVSRLVQPNDIVVETRGQGATERRIHHLLPPSSEAGRLILFEVFTPGGNWSSYPPHKHDTEDPPLEAYLEELYWYRFARPGGWAAARVYTADRSLDESFAPSDGDVILIPRGYHPVAAAAGYDAYYLNVMAGHHRDWRFTLDPDHAWLMDWDPTSPREA
jgi:5-deoxy-glucuronate isomerase